ncbi:hypothetical protein PVA17_18495 [Lysinibacillus sp. CNPSo 3705]|uniref:hypothetical protein n=1 Tax=Lysinibacillus sp. CNPSo 3705 TaxID=3028148 RepID=UPI0023641DE7|nr:hypothetical protein [Lysinibacillus sp. CNPSo 3705]MDD1504736.1 hypothetical protein [Lysinibacillus sp. CNPSo 3705]
MQINQRRQEVTQILGDNEVIFAAAKFIVEVERLHGNISKIKVKQAEQLRLPLLTIAVSDRVQANHARKRLEALNAAIEYANGDVSARKRYIAASQQADRLAEIVAKRVDRIQWP